jgi:hypothetical protein
MATNDKAGRQAVESESKEVPQYKLSEPAYIDDILYDTGATIKYRGVPGYHMEPVNDAAREMKEKHPSNYVDPIVAMTDLKMADAGALQMADLVGTAVAKALTAARA